jgi:glyoxylase-like metal-dependent hydrolase (beta-lactamase superfamily II)
MNDDDVRLLAPGLWSLGQKMGGRVHAFLCDGGDELTLVDTLYDTDGARILRLIAKIGRRPADLRHIVLTHAHRSHLGGLAALKRASGATIYAHEWEADIVAGERGAERVRLLPHRPLRTYIPFQLFCALGIGKHPPCPVDEFVKGGDRIGPLELIDAPGHSVGHLAFVWHDRKALLAGDAIATWPSDLPGWPSFTLNARKHRESLRRLVDVEPEILGVGHGPSILSGARARVRAIVDTLGQ